MYARITKFKMNAGSKDQAMEIMNGVKDDIMGLPGMHQFINTMDEDGSGHVIAIVESKETSEGNAERIQEIWSAFAGLLEAAPEMVGHEIVANWSN